MRPANSPIIFLKSADCSYSGQENIGSSAKNAYVFRYVKMYDRRLFLSICKVFTPLYTEYNLVFAVGQCSRKKHARLGMMLFGILALNFEVCGHTHVESANRPLFEKVYGTVAEIRRLRVVAQSLAQEATERGEVSAESAEERSQQGNAD